MRRFVFTFFISISLVLFVLLISCTKTENSENDLFSEYYALLQKNNYTPYDSLINFYRQLDSVLAKNSSPKLQFLKTTTEGRLYYRRGDYERSTQKYREANLKIESFVGTDSLIALNNMSAGLNFMNRALFDSAFLYFEKALHTYQLLGNTKMMHVVKANMAQAYYNKRDIESSLRIINRTLTDNPHKSVKLNLQHIKANILGSSGKIDSAMLLDREIIRKYALDNDNYLLSSFYNNLALCYLEKEEIDSALYYCKKSFQTDSVAAMEVQMAANLVLMGDIFRNIGNKVNAEAVYRKALNLFTDKNNIDK